MAAKMYYKNIFAIREWSLEVWIQIVKIKVKLWQKKEILRD